LKKIYISGNGSKSGCAELVDRICRFLENRAIVVGTSLEKNKTLPDSDIDLVISLGGDGTFLNMVGRVIERGLPIMGVNFGRLGFLTAGLSNDVEKLMEAYLSGKTRVYERMVLSIELHTAEGVQKRCALNDVLVSAGDLTRVTSLVVKVSDEPLFHFRGDGMIISTPTGSTAHSLSAGGSLVDPQIEAILLTPLSSQSMSSRPIIVRPSAKLEVSLSSDVAQGEVIFDGQRLGTVRPGDRVRVSRHPQAIKMVQLGEFRFLHRLADKLGWSESF
jgi:NAD+ kinase